MDYLVMEVFLIEFVTQALCCVTSGFKNSQSPYHVSC